MPCAELQIGNVTATVCGLPKRKRCFTCGKSSAFLCDYPVGKTKRGKLKTYDKNLCAKCRKRGVSAGVDFCPEHYPLAKAAYERRLAQNDGNGEGLNKGVENVAIEIRIKNSIA